MKGNKKQMEKTEKLSLVIPCYNEEESAPIFYREMNEVYQTHLKPLGLELEYIFVDDGSSDNTIAVVKALAEKDDSVRYLSFSRNFGKEAAMFAGMEAATGDYIATMDVDLQDPPALLPEMYDAIKKEGYDCVATRRETRKGEPPIRSFFARMFYRIINKLTTTKIVDGARDFRLMKRIMVEAILSDREYNRFSKGIFSWVGFRTKWLAYENIERSAGKTKWSFWKLFLYSIDGILAYSTVPLALVSVIGIIFCIISFLALCFVVIRALIFGDPVAGWPSMISIITFLGGIQLLCLGIIGLYVSKIYLETKRRPIYIIKEKK
ncbi:MAG: glycosyltransferase family 2 protein [Oscillospiraceae bacterium]|nr:glycosyltransferase family 2 protein [Oscillospiraceae bacterium]